MIRQNMVRGVVISVGNQGVQVQSVREGVTLCHPAVSLSIIGSRVELELQHRERERDRDTIPDQHLAEC